MGAWSSHFIFGIWSTENPTKIFFWKESHLCRENHAMRFWGKEGLNPDFQVMWKKKFRREISIIFGSKKFNPKSEEFLCAPSRNKTWWVKKESKVRKATKASRKSDDDARATRLESVHRSFQGFSSNQKNQSRFRYAYSRFGSQKGLHMMEESTPEPFQIQSKRWSGKIHRGSQ